MQTILMENSGLEIKIDTGDCRQFLIGDELLYVDDNNATLKLIITGRRWQRKSSGRIAYYCMIILAKEI